MERHGIGTDATVAEHINKQLERGYVMVASSNFGCCHGELIGVEADSEASAAMPLD